MPNIKLAGYAPLTQTLAGVMRGRYVQAQVAREAEREEAHRAEGRLEHIAQERRAREAQEYNADLQMRIQDLIAKRQESGAARDFERSKFLAEQQMQRQTETEKFKAGESEKQRTAAMERLKTTQTGLDARQIKQIQSAEGVASARRKLDEDEGALDREATMARALGNIELQVYLQGRREELWKVRADLDTQEAALDRGVRTKIAADRETRLLMQAAVNMRWNTGLEPADEAEQKKLDSALSKGDWPLFDNVKWKPIPKDRLRPQ